MVTTAVRPLVTCASMGDLQPWGVRRFAVLGAGFAGVSVAWHLLQHTTSSAPVCVELFDELGVGGGASGASGGLLHPYNPKGKLLWKGAEGWNAALRLLSVAETAYSDASAADQFGPATVPLAWRRGILRLAKEQKHAIDFQKNVNIAASDESRIACLGGPAARELVPGLEIPAGGLALHIPQAINVHPQRYLKALWLACELFSRNASNSDCPGTQAVLRNHRVDSLRELKGNYEAVIVCLGAQAMLLPELLDKLPLTSCRGVVAQLQAPQGSRNVFCSKAPNLLFGTWLAVQGERDLLLGATKDWGSMNASPHVDNREASSALEKLIRESAPFYPSIKEWEVKGWQAGLRAIPPRSALGSLPLVGCIDELVRRSHSEVYSGQTSNIKQTTSTKWWLFGGLGSRGLIHHGWLGDLVAKAVVYRDESLLPQTLKQW
ncbi:hypothetical protein R1sor_012862 [Riccia sorocarpa]|uniref:FAD dependent oxidoreductase domain-containing protein n=1 Tax=Riccia sorocarpa TaxID=122646 RepID=A0ABD3I924_9MARC